MFHQASYPAFLYLIPQPKSNPKRNLAMRFFPTAVLSVLLIQPALTQQTSLDDTLAIVASNIITARDLVERIDLMPWPDKTSDSTKIRGLNALVAEKLLALEGRGIELGNDPRTKLMTSALQKLFIRDELYRQEILSKINVSENELNVGVRRFSSEISVLAFSHESASAADSLAAALSDTKTADSLLKSLVSSGTIQHEIIIVHYGETEPRFEEAAYRAMDERKPEVVSPVRGTWLVVFPLDERKREDVSAMSLQLRRQRVETILRKRKEQNLYRKFTGEVLAPQRAVVDSQLFELVSEEMLSLLRHDATSHRRGEGFTILPGDVDATLTSLKGHLDTPIVSLSDAFITIGEVVEAFRYEAFAFDSLESEAFKDQFRGALKRIVEAELMAREGMQRNLQHATSVRRDMGTWSDHWVALELYRQMTDTIRVTDGEVIEFLTENGQKVAQLYGVSVQEVLSPDLDGATRVLEQIAEGEDIGTIARTLSAREAWRGSDGRSGFFLVAEHPAIGFAALGADTGTLVGPVRTREGYSVFTVLGKRKVLPEVEHIDSLFLRARNQLKVQKRLAMLDEYIAGLARKYNASLRYDTLNSITLTRTQMVTRRFLGFGGVIKAAPTLLPLWDWVKELHKTETAAP